ncbi:MAG: glycosyltransferase [Actinomycetota bacterium]
MAGTVIVSDDGSPGSYRPLLDSIESLGATVIRANKNSGIAAALNAGIAMARTHSLISAIMTLDQDSLPARSYLERALETLERANSAGLRPGLASASSYSGYPVPTEARHGRSTDFEYAFDPMQSGLVIPLATFDSIGGFDEGLFIDGVDSEFTARARAAHFDVIVGRDCAIEHHLGERGTARLLGREIGFNYHSPSRVYYICRNGTMITLRYARRMPGWVARRLVQEAKAHAMRALFSRGRGLLVRAAVAGYRDAFLRRSGPIPPALAARLAARA